MKRTIRGFAIYTEFKDYNGSGVRVQRSSHASRRLVWIFPEKEKHHVTGDFIAGAHLTVPMAKRVIKALDQFIQGKE